MKLSLCIAAKYHAENFRRIIDEAINHIDDIVVAVDEGAEPGIDGYRYCDGVKYHHRVVGGDFGGQRAFLVDNSSGDWIFHLDTDEILPLDLWPRLRAIAQWARAPLIVFPRRNHIVGVTDYLSWPDWQQRFHKRGINWVGKLHERLMPDVDNQRMPATNEYAIIHTKTKEDQERANILYSKNRGGKQAILIFEWKRPRYLKVCLDSLQRVEGIEDWPIILSIDGPEFVSEFTGAIHRTQHALLHRDHVGNLWHVTRSIEMAFQMGYERILFMDGDVIMRRDGLKSFPEKQPQDLFIGMVKGDPIRQPWMLPTCNLLHKEDVQPLLDYVKGKYWVGKYRPGFLQHMLDDYPGYDAVYCRYMIDTGKCSVYRDKSYVGHIGVCGVDSDGKALDLEMFTGDPSTWLNNAVRMYDANRHNAFTPPDFVYE